MFKHTHLFKTSGGHRVFLQVPTYPRSSSTALSYKQTLHSRADVSHGAHQGVHQELQLPTTVQMPTSVCAELHMMAPALSGAAMAICIPQSGRDAGPLSQGLSHRYWAGWGSPSPCCQTPLWEQEGTSATGQAHLAHPHRVVTETATGPAASG